MYFYAVHYHSIYTAICTKKQPIFKATDQAIFHPIPYPMRLIMVPCLINCTKKTIVDI